MCPISQLKTDKEKNGMNSPADRPRDVKEAINPVMSKPEGRKNRHTYQRTSSACKLKKQVRHILLVEDEIDVAIVTKTRLELAGYKVSAVNDGLEALDFVDKELPDLMLLDLKMPGLDGFSVYKRLKSNEATKDIPVLLFSGSGDCLSQSAVCFKQLEFGVDDLISKPYETKTLLKKIRKLIRKKLSGKDQELASGRQLVKRF